MLQTYASLDGCQARVISRIDCALSDRKALRIQPRPDSRLSSRSWAATSARNCEPRTVAPIALSHWRKARISWRVVRRVDTLRTVAIVPSSLRSASSAGCGAGDNANLRQLRQLSKQSNPPAVRAAGCLRFGLLRIVARGLLPSKNSRERLRPRHRPRPTNEVCRQLAARPFRGAIRQRRILAAVRLADQC